MTTTVRIQCPICKGAGGFEHRDEAGALLGRRRCEECEGARTVAAPVPVDPRVNSAEGRELVAKLEAQRKSDADAYTEGLRAMAEKCQRFDGARAAVLRCALLAEQRGGPLAIDDRDAIAKARAVFA